MSPKFACGGELRSADPPAGGLSMSVIDHGTTSGAPPVLAGPQPPEQQLTLWKFLRVLRDSSIATSRVATYSADILERRMFWRRTFFVNEPNAIKHILLDNAAHYTKT